MGVNRYGEHFVKRADPKGRSYYWATNDPPPQPTDHATDLTELENELGVPVERGPRDLRQLPQFFGANVDAPSDYGSMNQHAE